MKHTPGPWKADPNGIICGGQYGVTQVADTNWCFWSNRIFEMSKDERTPQEVINNLRDNMETSTANAKLIAAAPDLIEACKAASSALSLQYSMDGQFSRWQDDALYVMLNNAIRKATE
jgi:hypothetical protein